MGYGLGLFVIVLIVYSYTSANKYSIDHDHAVIETRQSISLTQDSLLKEIRTMHQVNLSLKNTVEGLLEKNTEIVNDYQRREQIKNNIIKDLTLSLDSVSDQLRTGERSELENRYRDGQTDP